MKSRTSRGFTLPELMVSMALGLVVIGGVTTVYVTTVGSSSSTLKASKLNQEMTTLMSVMASDIRRSGFWEGASATAPDTNPFSQWGSTALTVVDSKASNTALAANTATSGQCILYTYDANRSGASTTADIEATEFFGFRLNNGVVQMRESGSLATALSCDGDAAGDVWRDVTDGQTVTVTSLAFTLNNSTCLNTREDDGVDNDGDAATDWVAEANCYSVATPAATGDITVETRQVNIQLAGQLTEDAEVSATMAQDVRVRNDLIRIRP